LGEASSQATATRAIPAAISRSEQDGAPELRSPQGSRVM
jgi:hypothetical protein